MFVSNVNNTVNEIWNIYTNIVYYNDDVIMSMYLSLW